MAVRVAAVGLESRAVNSKMQEEPSLSRAEIRFRVLRGSHLFLAPPTRCRSWCDGRLGACIRGETQLTQTNVLSFWRIEHGQPDVTDPV
jgi:hypothetical protein